METEETRVWPGVDGERVIFLVDASGAAEHRLIQRWIARNKPNDFPDSGLEIVSLPPSRGRRPAREADPRMEACLATHDDPVLAPLRVAWLPDANSTWSPLRMFGRILFGDPYDPGRLRRWWTRRWYPERCCVIDGEPARLSQLRSRWRAASGTDVADTTSLSGFVTRQAALALERAERRTRGMRYKVPRFVHESIVERPAFQGTVAQLAWEMGSNTAEIGHRAASDLREIAATHSPYMIDLAAQFCRTLYTQGYAKKLDYDRRTLERIYTVGQRHPVVFLPSHRSNLDHLVLQYALYENGHPPNHTAGGDNMNFFPVGPLLRRSGLFFIRRTFKNDAVYKKVLGHYVDYLLEKRFPLEWYIEGGRSRSGKLLPPRFGMLAYVVDAYRRGKSDDVCVVPVSIVYDQIQDVGSYAAEQRGRRKEREGLRWFIKVLRSLRRHYGGVHIRFGDPIMLREMMGEPEPDSEPNADERGIGLQKVAFEVALRINRATPITPTSLVTLALLGALDRALTVDETMAALERLLAYVHKRQLPLTEKLDCSRPDDVVRTLNELVENGVVRRYAGGPDAVYAIDSDQHLAAAYYRNSVIHFFITSAICELALVAAAENDVEDRAERFHAETLALRDLLKFEFFFADKDEYRKEVRRELALHDSRWEEALAGDADSVRRLLLKFEPYQAHLVLRPFLEAYSVVAEVLAAHADDADPVDDKAFLAQCLGLGEQYLLQKKVRSAESVSNVLFASGLKLARNRGVLLESGTGTGTDDSGSQATVGRAETQNAQIQPESGLGGVLAAEIREAISRIDTIEALASSRRPISSEE